MTKASDKIDDSDSDKMTDFSVWYSSCTYIVEILIKKIMEQIMTMFAIMFLMFVAIIFMVEGGNKNKSKKL